MTGPARLAGTQLTLHLYIQPKASRDQWQGRHGDELKLAITAPPVDGKANAHLVKFLAKQFRVAKSKIEIIRGELGRHKTVVVHGVAQIPEAVAAALNESQ